MCAFCLVCVRLCLVVLVRFDCRVLFHVCRLLLNLWTREPHIKQGSYKGEEDYQGHGVVDPIDVVTDGIVPLPLINVFCEDKVPCSVLLATDMTNSWGETDLTTIDGTVPIDKCQILREQLILGRQHESAPESRPVISSPTALKNVHGAGC